MEGVTAADHAEPDLVVEEISHAYATRDGRVEALRDVSFVVEPRRFVGIVGPSGCGKSSLLFMMAGLIRPMKGRVVLRGRAVDGPTPAEVGVVFQDASLFPWKTAQENVEFPLELRGVPRRERSARARELLELVDLKDFAGRLPHELSGGMKQRVSIARGLSQDPRILLMDEPFAALDEQTRMTMGQELLRIWERMHKTVIFITHSLTEAVYLCDEVLVMSARPGVILERIKITLPRPRAYEMMATETFGRLRDRIWRLIRGPQEQR